MKKIITTLFTFMTVLFCLPVISSAGNGCGTGWNTKVVRDSYGGANFTDACNKHDLCYETCGKQKSSCDKTFRTEMKQECRNTFHKSHEKLVKDACLKIVDGYYESVKKVGRDAYNQAQEKSACTLSDTQSIRNKCQDIPNIEVHVGNKNKIFKKNTSWKTCTGYHIVFQDDGNFVVYNPSKKAVWSSNTHGKKGSILAMQADGNLVIYASGGKALWASHTHHNPSSFLAIQQDGNVVIYNSKGKALWATGTNGR